MYSLTGCVEWRKECTEPLCILFFVSQKKYIYICSEIPCGLTVLWSSHLLNKVLSGYLTGLYAMQHHFTWMAGENIYPNINTMQFSKVPVVDHKTSFFLVYMYNPDLAALLIGLDLWRDPNSLRNPLWFLIHAGARNWTWATCTRGQHT